MQANKVHFFQKMFPKKNAPMPQMSGIGPASKILTSSNWIALPFTMTFKFIKAENRGAYKNITGAQSRHKLGGSGSVQLLC